MRHLFTVTIVVLFAAACESATGPYGEGSRSHSASSGSSPLITPLDTAYASRVPGDTSFWAVRGRALDVVLHFIRTNGTPGDSLLEFQLSATSLSRYPDGTPFAEGDSVRITIQPDTTGQMQFAFEPSGLVFDSAAPGTLRMWCTHAAADLNGDGVVDTTDEQLWYEMAVWKREASLDPWVKQATTRSLDGTVLTAPIGGFTGFSVAS